MAKHIQDRIEARKQALKHMEMMQSKGMWTEASLYHEEHIAPLNEWLLARGIW